MAARAGRIGVRVLVLTGFLVAAYFLGRPIYWKLSATFHELRENHYDPALVKQGLSDLVDEAKRTVGWGHLESETTKGTKEDGSLVLQPEDLKSQSGSNKDSADV
ncbi:hypothetical protein O6H91_Y096800 [Diphasiastrum complanatum]|nr:hypothetical protein O6H91_Y096800 [Diphasiastrum complanatum]